MRRTVAVMVLLVFGADSLSLAETDVLLLLACSGTPAAAVDGSQPLPPPVDVPAGPPQVSGPGGAGMPELGGQPAREPAIAMASDLCFPDETLALTGDRLSGARLRIWAEGALADVEPLRSADDRMLAVVPKSLPRSTMLVWPVRGSAVGAPIRVNGATVWWSWPPRAPCQTPGQTIRLIGKGLQLPGRQPQVYLAAAAAGDGDAGHWLTVNSANPYHLEAALPSNLPSGVYRVWAHNGTGGRFGWSEATTIRVEPVPNVAELQVFSADEFGAVPDDQSDDAQALQSACDAAARAGGGVIRLSPGCYRLDRTIVLPKEAGRGIHLVGCGRGQHDPQMHALAGRHTVLRSSDKIAPPAVLVQVGARRSRLADVNFINGADGGGQMCVDVNAHDVVVERCRFIVLDRRPPVETSGKNRGIIDTGALQLDAPGESNIVVQQCEFFTSGAGIRIGLEAARARYPYTDYVCIRDCLFRGYFTGVYKVLGRKGAPAGFIGPKESGYRCCGVTNDNGKYTIIERCDFAGADREHGRVMNRAIQCHNSAVRGQYWAHNRAHDVGNHSSVGKVNRNMGEQLMFHFAYEGGGLFNVTDAGTASMSVDPADAKYAGPRPTPSIYTHDLRGSVVPEDVANNDHWVVLVCAGKGVGQFRVVRGVERSPERITLRVEPPWRVVPDATSRVVLQVMYRQNIVYANAIDSGLLDPEHKSHGVIFWYNAVENIVAENHLRNLTAGVVFNHGFRNPTAWNITRDNTIEHIHGYSGDTSLKAASYVTHFRVYEAWPAPADRVWYSIGDVSRGNRGRDAHVAVYLHTRFGDRRMPRIYPPHPDGGIMLGVVENNDFQEVQEGIVVSTPANWSLLRNNRIATTPTESPPAFDETSNKAVDPTLYLRVEPADRIEPER